MTILEKYYNSFNEDHRLTTRHGLVEFSTNMKYIHDFLPQNKASILDIGAGTGRYAIPLANEGYSVTAVELVPHNLKVLESKHSLVNCWPGDARDLHFLQDNSFDLTLLFGPLYHLHNQKDMLKAFEEAKRVTRPNGIIMASYIMNEYSIITYCFKQKHIKEVLNKGTITDDFHTISSESELFTYFRLEDIDLLNKLSGLHREKIIASDGAADYMRKELNALDSEEFDSFLEYHLKICERQELLGASSHVLDILRKIPT